MNERMDRLFENLPSDVAVFINGYANIFYYSGFTSADAYLLLTRDERFIITDSRYFTQAKIEAPDFTLIDIKKGWKEIFGNIKETVIAFEEDKITYGEYNDVSNMAKQEFLPSQSLIDMPRRNKTRNEIEIIRQAEEKGDKAFIYLLEKLHTGMTEREAARLLENKMKELGAKTTSFDTISASGVRSCMPHGVASDKVIEKGDFLTLDFGCIYKGYCSDMTRTVVFGTPNSRQTEIYDIVLRAQTEAINGLTLGMNCSDADKIARDIIAYNGYGECFTHSLGHSVGIEIHESPNFSPKSHDVLEEGNVLSVEPGIYIDGELGVRIEDIKAVVEGEIVNLTHSPKELIVI